MTEPGDLPAAAGPAAAGEARDRFELVAHMLLVRSDARASLWLLQRGAGETGGGWWVPPGGHVQCGEAPLAAAVRECREECGVVARDPQPVAVLPYRWRGGQGVNFVFIAARWEGEPQVAEPARFAGGAFFASRSLPDAAAPWLRDVLRMRIGRRWYQEMGFDD